MKKILLRQFLCLLFCMAFIFALTPMDVMADKDVARNDATVTDEETANEEAVIEDDQTEVLPPEETQAPVEIVEEAPLLVRTASLTAFADEMQKLYAMDKQKKQGLYAEVPGAEHTVSRVIVKGEPNYEGYEPLKIVQDPYGCYIIQFSTPEEAERFVAEQTGNSNVEWAELDGIISIPKEAEGYNANVFNDSEGSHCGSWGTGNVEADKLQEYILSHEDEIQGRKVIVAVVDTGVDMTHEFLQDRIADIPEWTVTEGETVTVYKSDFVDGDNVPSDEYGHGTHVTGTVVDCTYYLGDYISILPVRVMDNQGQGDASKMALGIYYASASGADVMNLSFGKPASEGYYINEAIRNVVNDGCTVVCSSGNDHTYTYTKSPANMTEEGVVVVGGVGYHPNKFSANIFADERYLNSNYGDSVDVAAPGYYITSSVITSSVYDLMSGTSMAAPHVTAAAAMIKLLYPDFDPAAIEKTIKSCTWDIGEKGEDIEFGAGTLKLGKLNEEITAPVITSNIESKTAEYGELAVFEIKADGGLLSYDWEYREGSEAEWKDVLPQENNSPAYAQLSDYGYDGYQFRCRVSNPKGAEYSAIATLHVAERTGGNVVASGTLDTGLKWEISPSMVLTITGNGKIPNFKEGEAPWYPWHNWIETVQIPEVTRIGSNAFRDFTRLTTVADSAFHGCIGVIGLVTPDSLTQIGKNAFRGCIGLRKAYLSSNIDTLESFAFYGCRNLEQVVFQSSITEIDRMTFYLCSNLKSINIGYDLEEIHDRAFYFCDSLTDVYYGGSASDWSSIEVQQGNEPLDNAMFHYGSPEHSGTFATGVTWEIDAVGNLLVRGSGKIPDFASDSEVPWNDYRDEIKSIEIRNGVTEIGNWTFCGLKTQKAITIPDSVTRIGDYAFKGCWNIANIDLSSGLERVCKYAFSLCTSLEEVYYHGQLGGWRNIEIEEGNEFLTEAVMYMSFTENLHWNLDDNGLLTVAGKGSMDGFHQNDDYPWFPYRDEIKTVYVGSEIRDIGEEAFYECESLETVYMGYDVKRVSARAFYGCSNIQDVYYSGTADECGDVVIEDGNEPITSCNIHYNPFGKCGLKLYWFIDDDGTLTIDGTGVMNLERVSWQDYDDLLKTVIIKGGMTELNQNAFYNSPNLEEVVISGSDLSISEGCFSGCRNLKTLILKEGVTEIGDRAFYSCMALTNVAFSKDLVKICQYAFFYDMAIEKVFYSGSEEEWSRINISGMYNYGIDFAPKYFNYTGPIINVQPEKSDVLAGAEVAMSVEAIGIAPEYQWYRKAGNSSNWIPVDGATEATYVFNAAANLDGSNYYCEVTDEIGSTPSNPASLSVSYSVPKITRQPKSVLGTEGKTVTFTVAATGGGLHYQWQKKLPFSNQWVDVTGNGANTARFKVTIKKANSGTLYRCKVTNLAGTTYSGTCKAEVIDSVIKPPVFKELK